MSYALLAGLFCVGVGLGFLIEAFFRASHTSDLESENFRLLIENQRLRRGGR